MGKIEVYQCDDCKDIIPTSPVRKDIGGYIIEGNIYVASDQRGGLIGGNMEDEALPITTLCTKCLCKHLQIHMVMQ
jgi:hypothetical protein